MHRLEKKDQIYRRIELKMRTKRRHPAFPLHQEMDTIFDRAQTKMREAEEGEKEENEKDRMSREEVGTSGAPDAFDSGVVVEIGAHVRFGASEASHTSDIQSKTTTWREVEDEEMERVEGGEGRGGSKSKKTKQAQNGGRSEERSRGNEWKSGGKERRGRGSVLPAGVRVGLTTHSLGECPQSRRHFLEGHQLKQKESGGKWVQD